MKKLLGILLSLLMLASCAASPAATDDSTPTVQGDNPSAPETEAPETEIRDNVPEMDFGQDIFSTRSYDLGDTWWCNELRDGLFKNMFAENNRNLASEIAAQEKIINKTLNKVVDKLSN